MCLNRSEVEALGVYFSDLSDQSQYIYVIVTSPLALYHSYIHVFLFHVLQMSTESLICMSPICTGDVCMYVSVCVLWKGSSNIAFCSVQT